MTPDPNLTALAVRVAGLLVARRETIAVCESSSGGLIAAALVAVPGASALFHRRHGHLHGRGASGVAGHRPGRHGGHHLRHRAVRSTAGADHPDPPGHHLGIAETGASGPTGNRYGHAAGHACLAVAGPRAAVTTLETGSADRAGNMVAFAKAALTLLADQLAG